MPELPEVETVCRGLSPVMVGQKIAAIDLHRAGLRIPFPKALAKLRGAKVTGIARRAKYLLLRLDNGQTMIVHLGMSGRMVIHAKGKIPEPGKHDHMVLRLSGGGAVFFNDARRFGLVDLVETAQEEAHRFFKALGPEPLARSFTPACLLQAFAGKKIAAKVAIMDQRVVVGVGNIYAAEAFFDARIDPRRKAGDLTTGEIARLVPAVKKVLRRAIAKGGSSLRDYVQADGELGYFQHHFAVYGRNGAPCPSCGGIIHKIVQGGRSTFFCPKCQK